MNNNAFIFVFWSKKKWYSYSSDLLYIQFFMWRDVISYFCRDAQVEENEDDSKDSSI